VMDRLQEQFVEAVPRYFRWAIDTPELAEQVIERLVPTRKTCDALTFHREPEALAYLLWHEVDRYHRTMRALDRVFELGWLPLAKADRRLSLLEVGSGPAPAGFATVDYYASLAAWARTADPPYPISGHVLVHALDRGEYWPRLIHHLAETLPSTAERASIPRFFGVAYTDLSGFDPRRTHHVTKARIIADWEAARDAEGMEYWPLELDGGDPAVIERLAAESAPPSAYDLIIASNFLTTPDMLRALKDDLEILARSLVPGGVLLALSGATRMYKQMWADFANLPSVKRLDHVIQGDLMETHPDPRLRTRTQGATLDALRYLNEMVPNALEGHIEDHYARRLHGLDVEPFDQPPFIMHAFKRGRRAMSSKEVRRMARRRHSG
jgi:hypothetical protein